MVRKHPHNGPDMGADLIWKTLKNFTTIKATVMTLISIIYLNKIFHFATFCGLIYRPSKSINKKPLIKS